MNKISIAVILFCFLFAQVAGAYVVAFNVKTKKYHSLSCRWAAACTKNCINIEKSKAISMGGIPCKVCGGGNIIHFHLQPLPFPLGNLR